MFRFGCVTFFYLFYERLQSYLFYLWIVKVGKQLVEKAFILSVFLHFWQKNLHFKISTSVAGATLHDRNMQPDILLFQERDGTNNKPKYTPIEKNIYICKTPNFILLWTERLRAQRARYKHTLKKTFCRVNSNAPTNFHETSVKPVHVEECNLSTEFKFCLKEKVTPETVYFLKSPIKRYHILYP